MTQPPTVAEEASPVIAAAATSGEATGGAFGVKGLAWSIFEGARNPYYNLIVIYVFASYFATVVAGGGAFGFMLSGLTITIAGIISALTAPVLGVLGDKAGRRKPLIAIFIAGLIICSALLWWSTPEGPFGVWATVTILIVAYCCYGYSEVLHNAMLPQAGRPSALPVISGLGLAIGNIASVGILLFFLFGLMLPAEPLLPLDKETHQPERFTGPFIAVWMFLLMIPFFLFMPDNEATGVSWKRATADLFRGEGRHENQAESFGSRVAALFAYLRNLVRMEPNAMRYLLARTIYADAMSALLSLGAVYGRTYLGWEVTEIIVFGLLGLTFGAVGGLVGGAMDRSIGPKRTLFIALSMLIVSLFVQLSISREAVFFGLIPSGQDVWASPIFPTLSDLTYAGMVVPVAIAVVACISASRHLLVRVAPPARIGEFFGLYAIAGTVTVWMGPGVVSLLTWVSGDQRIGMAGIGLMFLLSLIVLAGVRDSRIPEQAKAAGAPV